MSTLGYDADSFEEIDETALFVFYAGLGFADPTQLAGAKGTHEVGILLFLVFVVVSNIIMLNPGLQNLGVEPVLRPRKRMSSFFL